MTDTLYIVVDTRTKLALYGINGITLTFISLESAERFAGQMFNDESNYIVIQLRIKL